MSGLLRMLSAESGLFESDLTRIIANAPRRYKVFTIVKRSGGLREIAQPAREVKLLQRILVAKVLSVLPVHDAAKAYRVGMSVRDNAEIHAGSGSILKMDFKDFFPSIKAADWIDYCKQEGMIEKNDVLRSAQILFREPNQKHTLQLSIGAPSSPIMCNILLFNFDSIVHAEAEKRGINYTRYADDMTFSGQRIGMLKDMPSIVEETCKKIGRPRLEINREKTVFVTPARRRVVTGVILSNDGNIGVGWQKKRLISAQVHHALLGKLDAESLNKLAGQLAFINVAEPSFIQKLKIKYGDSIIIKIQRASRPSLTEED